MNRLAKAKRLIALNLAILLLLTLVPIGALASISGISFPFWFHTGEQEIMIEQPGTYTFRIEAYDLLGPQWLGITDATGTEIVPTNIVIHNDFTADITFDLQVGVHTLIGFYQLGAHATDATLRLWEDDTEPASHWIFHAVEADEVDGVFPGWASPWFSRPTPGETVTISPLPEHGFEFVRWEIVEGNVTLSDPIDQDAIFTMPSENVRLQPVFARAPGAHVVTVAVSNPDWGGVWPERRMAFAGEGVGLSAQARWRWNAEAELMMPIAEFVRWEVVSGDVEIDDIYSENTFFTMPDPARDVEIRAVFAPLVSGVTITPAGNFQLNTGATRALSATVAPEDAMNRAVTWTSSNPAVATVDDNGLVRAVGPGTATITVTTVEGGFTDSIVVTVPRPDDNFTPPQLPPDDDNGDDGDNDDDNGASVPPPSGDFGDVSSDSWYYQYVRIVGEAGIMQGVGGGNFAPDDGLSRAMLATILWRLAGEPDVSDLSDFTDVREGQWYTEAIAWAERESVVQGIGGGQFAPQQYITREQFAAMMFRFAEAMGEEMSVPADFDLSQFTDANSVGDWAENAMRWVVYNGLVSGTTSTTLSPRTGANRAQSAAILARYMESFPDGV